MALNRGQSFSGLYLTCWEMRDIRNNDFNKYLKLFPQAWIIAVPRHLHKPRSDSCYGHSNPGRDMVNSVMRSSGFTASQFPDTSSSFLPDTSKHPASFLYLFLWNIRVHYLAQLKPLRAAPQCPCIDCHILDFQQWTNHMLLAQFWPFSLGCGLLDTLLY